MQSTRVRNDFSAHLSMHMLEFCPAARYLEYFVADNEWSGATAFTAVSMYGTPGVEAVAASMTRAEYVYTLAPLLYVPRLLCNLLLQFNCVDSFILAITTCSCVMCQGVLVTAVATISMEQLLLRVVCIWLCYPRYSYH